MSLSFIATYPGRCGACGDKVEPGDKCTYEDGSVVHEYCVDKADPDEPARNERRCKECYQIHAGECL